MLYTKPATDAQKQYYSRFAGVLAMHVITARVIQYLIWLPIATVALTVLIQQTLAKFFEIPFYLLFGLSFLVIFFLHRLMSAGYKAHLFNRWDNDPDTNSSLWLYIFIGIVLAGLEWKTTANFFQSNITPPAVLQVGELEAPRQGRHTYEQEQYELRKKAIEDNAARQEEMIAAPTLYEIKRLERTKARTTEDRTWKRTRLANLQNKLESDPRIIQLRQNTAARLDTLLVAYQATVNRIEADHQAEVNTYQQENAEAIAAYKSQRGAANRYAGFVSIFSLGIFLVCRYWQVRIMTRSGIFPLRQFTDLSAHGGTWEKGYLAISDVFTRMLHKFFYAIHKSGSETAGELRGFDGQVIMKDGNYQDKINPPKSPEKLNGNSPFQRMGKI